MFNKLALLDIRKNLIHSNHIFVTNVQLMSKATQFVTKLVLIICGTLVTSVHVITWYMIQLSQIQILVTHAIIMCDYHKFWSKYWWKLNINHPLWVAFIDGWQLHYFYNYT
jgi:hypothetical protein